MNNTTIADNSSKSRRNGAGIFQKKLKAVFSLELKSKVRKVIKSE